MPSSNTQITPPTPEVSPWSDEFSHLGALENQPPEATPEQPTTPVAEFHERPADQKSVEKNEGVLDSAIESIRNTFKRTKKPTTVQTVMRDEVVLQVEKIMEDGLKDAFKELTPVQQQEFKIAGEKTALQIRDLLRSAHVKIKKIFRLLLKWLRMLPGVNVFFLEQEAKIKADKILTLNSWNKNNKL